MPLDERSLRRAYEYNLKRDFSREQLELIQGVVGLDPITGKLDEATTTAIAEWQSWMGLEQDGKLGAQSWRRMQRLVEIGGSLLPEMVRVGAWIDDAPKTVLDEAYFDRLVELGIEVAAIMLNRCTVIESEDPWKVRWRVEQLEQLRALATARDIDVVLTTWPLPKREVMERTFAEMPELLDAAGAVAWEIDTEGNWDESRLTGFASLDGAAEHLVAGMRRVAEPRDLELELTTFPHHRENGEGARIAPHMDRLFPQAYSVHSRGDNEISWEDDRLGPGRMQSYCILKTETVPGIIENEVALGLGLAAYDQVWPGRDRVAALEAALDTAAVLGVGEVRYWSSKWILGAQVKDRDPPVIPFLLGRPPRVDADDWQDESEAEAPEPEPRPRKVAQKRGRKQGRAWARVAGHPRIRPSRPPRTQDGRTPSTPRRVRRIVERFHKP